MNVKSYFDKELVTTLVFAVLGIAVGYASFAINNSIQAFFVMLLVAVAFYLALGKFAKIKQDRRWWLGNAAIIYVLVWIVSWTIYYNVWLR